MPVNSLDNSSPASGDAKHDQQLPKPVSQKGKMVWFLRLCVVAGFAALGFYFSWWFIDGRIASFWLALVFGMAAIYAGTQLVGNWLLYLWARQPTHSPAWPEGLTVDVLVTAYKEPYDMIERTLAAACAMRGEHQTWLLDDGHDPRLEEMARRVGAGYLTRPEHSHAKAGNVNATLPRTTGDIIAIFEVDHVPKPDYLERSVGFFADPQMGFVQVMLTFANGDESWVSQAAIETSLEFYNPTSMGADGVGSVTLMGSNALIRRKALESIGGYQPGLAEDLATSISLHAAGWKSAYVAEPLAPGLAPPGFDAWFVQQLKWARGVFELLLTAYPRLFARLSWGQRLSYSVRMTKYWIGPVVGLHLFATIAILIFGNFELRGAFHAYLIHIAPLALADTLIRHVAFRIYRHHSTPSTSLARAVALVYATWPIYMLAWGMAVLRVPLKFKSTPRSATGGLNPLWLFPQIAALLLLLAGTGYTVFVKGHPTSLLLMFAVVQSALQLIFLAKWLYSGESFQVARIRPQSLAPMAVLEVDFNNLPEEIKGLERYQRAFMLFRLRGQPVGQVILNVENGRLSRDELQQAILENADTSFWQRWVEGYLEWEPPFATGIKSRPATVVVCTRDRPTDLRRCLEAISRLPDDGQEVIVVDSCSSSEATREVVAEFPGVRYVREEYPGLNRARNRAILEASHEVIAITDDDAAPDPGWLRALVRNFKDPRVVCVTGLTMPLELETEAQQWFEQNIPFNRGYYRKILDKNVLHPLSAGQAGAGANMAFLRRVFAELGAFDEALDAGTPTLSGGDTEMFARILSRGYQLVYDPAALCWHRHRRTWAELRRTMYGYGRGTYAFWTRKLWVEGEWSVLILALNWGIRYQLPQLFRSFLRLGGSMPVDLMLAELLGCVSGPWAYLSARRQINGRASYGRTVFQQAAPGEHRYTHL